MCESMVQWYHTITKGNKLWKTSKSYGASKTSLTK